VWATEPAAANSAVSAPTQAITVESSGAAAASIGFMRVIRNTPAVTIVAAWIRADTGVGPSIASGSHRYSGSWADSATAPLNRNRAISVAYFSGSSPDVAAPLSASYTTEPTGAKPTSIASMKPH